MNRSQTVAAVARRLYHLRRSDVDEVLSVLIEVWAEELLKPGGYIYIEELGKIYVERQRIRVTGVVRKTFQDEGKPTPLSLNRCYFRFRPSDSLRERLLEIIEHQEEHGR